MTLEDEPIPAPAKTRTSTVVLTLVAVALILSYLVSYALTDAFIAADLLRHWTPGNDPRPRRLIIGFLSLLGIFASIAGTARYSSQRQLRSIDAMDDESEG